MTGATVIVCGSRKARHRAWTLEQLDRIDAERRIAVVIEGGQRAKFAGEYVGGVDLFAHEWACARNRYGVTMEAEWKRYGRRAGPIRNGEMLRSARIDFVVAFPGEDGTSDMVRQAQAQRPSPVEIVEIARRAAFVYVPHLSPQNCWARQDVLHVFGDNVEGWGKKGQACIREMPNAVGIPTKWAPREDPEAYFTDRDLDDFRLAAAKPLTRLREHIEAGGTVFWPEAGIGTGLAELATRAPRLLSVLKRAEARLLEIARQRAPYAIPGASLPRGDAA